MGESRLTLDPRIYQIAVLAALLTYGLLALNFDVSALQCVLVVAAALATQAVCTRIVRLPTFDPKSALISSLSLCLLLRTNHLALAVFAAVLTIALKFAFRVRNKHVFNPTNGTLFVLLLVDAPIWLSPGQWGSAAFFAFLMACLGGLVVNRAARSDVTFAFIAFYGALVVGRSLALGEPLTIPLHRLENGALLLFTFFMISDPKTTPDSRVGRVFFALLVALGAYVVQFKLFRTNGLIWSLGAFSLLVPVIDRILPGARYAWAKPAPTTIPALVDGELSSTSPA